MEEETREILEMALLKMGYTKQVVEKIVEYYIA
jgi:hypothetical protein